MFEAILHISPGLRAIKDTFLPFYSWTWIIFRNPTRLNSPKKDVFIFKYGPWMCFCPFHYLRVIEFLVFKSYKKTGGTNMNPKISTRMKYSVSTAESCTGLIFKTRSRPRAVQYRTRPATRTHCQLVPQTRRHKIDPNPHILWAVNTCNY